MSILDDLIYSEAELDKLALDNSILDVFASCPRMFLYQKVWKLRPSKQGPQLTFGSGTHAGLEAYYSNKTQKEVELAVVREALKLDPEFPKSREDAKAKGFKEEYSLAFMVEMIDNYMRHYPIEEEAFKVMVGADGAPMLEQGFALHLTNGTLIGKMDGVLEGPQLLEHKTTARALNDSYLSQYVISNQIKLYMAALREIIGTTPKKCIVNCMMVKEYKKPRNDADSKFFSRVPVRFTDDQLDQALRQFEFRINQIKNFLRVGFDAFYQCAPKACTYNYSRCAYFPLCMAQEKEVIEMLIAGGSYVMNDWVPYDLENAPIKVEVEARKV